MTDAERADRDAWSTQTSVEADQRRTREGAMQTLRTNALAALADNRMFLGLSNPTIAQTSAQVKALTRQTNGLIRLVAELYDGTD